MPNKSDILSLLKIPQISYSLLIFFCGMFITIDGFNKTGIPSALWDVMEPYAKIDHLSGVAVLAAVILFLSNLASNVPTGVWTMHFHHIYAYFLSMSPLTRV